MKVFTCAAFFSLCALSVGAFAPQASSNERSSTSLQASKPEGFRVAAFSAITAAFVAANVAASPVLAVDNDMQGMFGSSEVIAARSGGRAGGRASSGGASYARPSSSYSSPSYRSSTTIITPPPSPTVVISPPVSYGYSSYSYNPLGGLGMGYALGSMNNLGNDIRDMQQEGEIRRANAELQQSKMKEAELEARLRQLEMQNAMNR